MKVLNSLYTSIPPSLEVPKNLGSYLKTYLYGGAGGRRDQL